MRIYKNNELRDILIVFMVLATFLSVAVKYKSTSPKKSVRIQDSFEKYTFINNKGQIVK